MKKIGPIRTDYGEGSCSQMRAKMLDFTMDKVGELIDIINKLTEDKGEKCVLCNGNKIIKDHLIDGWRYRTCPQCNGSGVKDKPQNIHNPE